MNSLKSLEAEQSPDSSGLGLTGCCHAVSSCHVALGGFSVNSTKVTKTGKKTHGRSLISRSLKVLHP